MQNQANSENLHDFLEEKICMVLNLPTEREYFLRFVLSKHTNAYHCVLLDKEILADYVKDATEYLTHPCFLCEIQNGYVLIKDWNLNWILVGFNEQNIVDFYALESLENTIERLKDLNLNMFWLWEVESATLTEKELLKKLESKFTIHYITQSLENIELLESCNFNPLEKSQPFLKTHLGVACKFLVAGVALGAVLWIILAFIGLLNQRKNAGLTAQIHTLQNELETLSKNRTQAQNTLINLQEKLENLQTIYKTNAESLKDFEKEDFQIAQLIFVLNPYLEKLNVKIAYFGLEKKSFSLLLLGENALKILEAIEKESLGKVEEMAIYGAFVWSVIKR